jgi:hypothetical protein
MNTSSALNTIRTWIAANVSGASSVSIYNDEIPDAEGTAVAIQPSPAPSNVSSYADDGDNGIPDRRVERTFNFLVRSLSATTARNLAEAIVTAMDMQTLKSGGTQIDCFSPVLAQFIDCDDKGNSIYSSAITCQYDINERE